MRSRRSLRVEGFIGSDQIANQVFAVDAVLHANRRVTHFRLARADALDSQFDAVAANSHLMVDPSNVFQHPITASTCEVAGAIQTLARCAGTGSARTPARCAAGR